MTITSIAPRIAQRDRIQQLTQQPVATAATATQPHPEQAAPNLASSTEARGFAFYVGLDELASASAGVSLPGLVEQLKQLVADLVPGARTHATVALAPRNVGGHDLEVVRRALHDPSLRAATDAKRGEERGVTIDLTRQRVTVDGRLATLTYKEFGLLAALVTREGETVDRDTLLDLVWEDGSEDRPTSRTIDVHVRRLRAKLGRFEDIVRTVRGVGYRYDRHADVVVFS